MLLQLVVGRTQRGLVRTSDVGWDSPDNTRPLNGRPVIHIRNPTSHIRHRHTFRSSNLYCTASPMCSAVTTSMPARSAMVRLTRRILS